MESVSEIATTCDRELLLTQNQLCPEEPIFPRQVIATRYPDSEALPCHQTGINNKQPKHLNTQESVPCWTFLGRWHKKKP